MLSLSSVTHTIFWDFDGVLVDSLALKAEAFQSLFSAYSEEFRQYVASYHFNHPSKTRNQKIQHYLNILNERDATNEILVKQFSDYIAENISRCRINSKAIELIKSNPHVKHVILSAASPEDISIFFGITNTRHLFSIVYSLSVNKSSLVNQYLSTNDLHPSQCLMVGDSVSDYETAIICTVPFNLWHPSGNPPPAIAADTLMPW